MVRFLEDNNQTYRMSAVKVRISDIVNGKYFYPVADQKKAGYVITPFGRRLTRANILGTVTEKFVNEEESYCSITIDDGTENIKVKAFKEKVKNVMRFEVGDMVLAIGKIRDYSGEIYVAAEIVTRLVSADFESMRRMELLLQLLVEKRIVDELRAMHDVASLEELKDISAKKFSLDEEQLSVILQSLGENRQLDYKPVILKVMDKLDSGSGVEMHKMFEQSELSESIVEATLNSLLSEGIIFEPLPGIFKKV